MAPNRELNGFGVLPSISSYPFVQTALEGYNSIARDWRMYAEL